MSNKDNGCATLIGLWIGNWMVIFIIAFWDAALMMWFLDASNVAALALGYWQLYWISLAIMMPVGTMVGLGISTSQKLKQLN